MRVLAANESFGSYRVVQSLGKGSMGIVYKALDASGREVAIKVMSAALADDPDLVERFRREAMAAASLSHPNITGVLDFGRENEQLFMTMELLDGADLSEVIAAQSLPSLGDKLAVMTQVADGMAFVHASGMVHRDLKPGNIHLTPTGIAKIMDFGLVRFGDSNMTATGTVMGSPSYMCPELLKGQKADARSDVFSLGAVFYELLSGRRAFGGKGITQIMMNVLMQEPEPIAHVAPDVPAAIAGIVARCLQKEPAHRYRSAGELHAALEVARAIYG
ncbi:MAG: serine/threonine-protein kinase [Vicinamibacteria bacterium]